MLKLNKVKLFSIIKLCFYVFKTKPDFIYIKLKIYLYNSKNMKKLKWHFDKENNEWFVNELEPFQNDGCLIRRTGNKRHPDEPLF